MVFDRKLSVTVLGNAGAGKTTLIKRIKGEPLITEKTTAVSVEKRKIKLLSQANAKKLSRDRYRFYTITAVDTPGDFTLRRQWREAMRKQKTDVIIFMLDPNQEFIVQKTKKIPSHNACNKRCLSHHSADPKRFSAKDDNDNLRPVHTAYELRYTFHQSNRRVSNEKIRAC